MRRIALANQKGGCGKTTTAVNLAASLAALNHPVLLIDLDPQGHSTLALGRGAQEGRLTLFDLLCEESSESVGIEDVALPIYDCLDLVPSDVTLFMADQRLADLPGREERLREKIDGLNYPYEYVLVDCPPNLGILTINALLAAGEVIIPVDPGAYSLHGLASLERTLNVLRDRLEHSMEKRILPVRIDRRINYHRRFIEYLHDKYAGEVFDATIRRSVKVTEAAARGRPLIRTARTSGVAEDFCRLAAEVAHREIRLETTRPRLQPVRPVPIKFALERPEASSVSVAGTFNNWDPGEAFLKGPGKTGMWRTSIRLRPGEYQYRFVVDGEWMTDPENPEWVPSPFGGRNSIVRVDIPRPKNPRESRVSSVPPPDTAGREKGAEDHA
jgi:chromosome partitioning protein